MKIALALLLLILFTALTIVSYPATAACITAGGKLKSAEHIELVRQARLRIESKFGPLQSRPTVYIFDQENEFWPLRLNVYGSTSFLGYKTCVAIGPKGQNVDVVAHELMHAEIENRAGFWGKVLRIPVWFDEGLAMQVDYRQRYDTQRFSQTSDVTALRSSRDFFSSNSDTLTYNYAAAKSEVDTWLSQQDGLDIYDILSEVKRGASFDSVWQPK